MTRLQDEKLKCARDVNGYNTNDFMSETEICNRYWLEIDQKKPTCKI